MSDTTALTDLARFIGQSQLAGDDAAAVKAGVRNANAALLKPKAAKRGVSDLLGVVLTLSARTRRSLLPKVEIDLDVFAPDGSRAVRLYSADR